MTGVAPNTGPLVPVDDKHLPAEPTKEPEEKIMDEQNHNPDEAINENGQPERNDSTSASIATAELPATPVAAIAVIEIPPAGQSVELEVVGSFTVHPLASRFPLIVGKDFDDLVEAAARAGRLQAVEVHDGLLIDGRNRVRVVEELRQRGIEIDLPVVAWEPSGEETVEEHIWSVNANRRHLTDDQRAAIGISFLPFIRRSCDARQAATRFGQRAPVEEISSPPAEPAAGSRRSSREKDAASSVGQFAAMCNIGLHKARQAMAIADGVEAGEISSVEIVAIATGERRLRDRAPAKRSSGGSKAAKKEAARPEAELMFEAAPDSPAPTDQVIRERWERFKRPFAIGDHREVRRLLKQIITEEQREFDQ